MVTNTEVTGPKRGIYMYVKIHLLISENFFQGLNIKLKDIYLVSVRACKVENSKVLFINYEIDLANSLQLTKAFSMCRVWPAKLTVLTIYYLSNTIPNILFVCVI